MAPKQTIFAALALGGGDTDLEVLPQLQLVGKLVGPGTTSARFGLPAGTQIVSAFVAPRAGAVPTTGTVAIGTDASPTAYRAAGAATAWSLAAASSQALLSADTEVVMTVSGLDGYAVAGLQVILPLLRS